MSRFRLIGVVSAVLLIGMTTAGSAQGAQVKNGNFEKGNFKNWETRNSDAGTLKRGMISSNRWRLYTKKTRSVGKTISSLAYARGGSPGIRLPKPKGKYSPFIDMNGPGHNVLYRTLKVPSNAETLKLKAFWHNDAGEWHFGGSFLNPTDGDQYFSIDLLDRKADPESAKKGDVLENIYSPKPKPFNPDPPRASSKFVSSWKGYKANVKKYRGDKVTLRLVEVDTLSFNYVGIDNVKFGK